jgi:hypothetical protein
VSEFDDDFLEVLGIEEREDYQLSPDAVVLEQRSYKDLDVEYISNLKVRRAVPKVEVSYFSSSKVEDASGDMLAVEDGEVTWEEAVPGYQYATDGIVFRHETEELKAKLGSGEGRRLVTTAYSAGYGLRSIIARNMGVDSLDVQCSVDLTKRDVRLTVYDGDVGGSGLTHTAFQDLERFLLDTQTSLESCVCDGFCEKCLLVPRTSPYVVERGLLNRFDGLSFITS